MSMWAPGEPDPMPSPSMWPQCPTCHTAYIHRRALTFDRGWLWVWEADCKHKQAPILVDADGPVKDTP